MHIEEVLLQIYFSLVPGNKFSFTAGGPSYEVKQNKWENKFLYVGFLRLKYLK